MMPTEKGGEQRIEWGPAISPPKLEERKGENTFYESTKGIKGKGFGVLALAQESLGKARADVYCCCTTRTIPE